MKFDLYGYELEYSKGIENYNYIKVSNEKFIQKMEQEFEGAYYRKFNNMEEALKGIRGFIFNYVMDVVKWGVEFLNINGVHTYSEQRFLDEYGSSCFELMEYVVNDLEEQYFSIIADQEEAARYRAARKDARGRWQGGGFGIDGAIQGALSAGAANMASGLAHSAVNAVGNIGSSISASMQKSEMFKNKSKVKMLRTCTADGMKIAYDNIALIVRKETDIPMERPLYDGDDLDAQNAIIANIKKGYIKDKEDILVECANILLDNPYNFDAYDQFLQWFADPDNAIENMSVYFGLSAFVDLKMRRVKEQLEALDYFDAEKLQSEVESVYEWMDRFGVEKKPYMENVDNVIALLGKLSRTVDENEYESEEEAQKVLSNIKQYLGKIKATSGNDIDAINKLIADIEKSNIKSKEKYIKFLKNKLVEEDGRYREVKGKIYDSREKATIARAEAIEIDSMINAITSMDVLAEVKDKVKQLQSQDLIEKYSTYLDLFDDVIESQKIEDHEKKISECTIRLELAIIYDSTALLVKKANKLNCINEAFKAWFDEWTSKYTTVNGKACATPSAADKEYYKWIKHATQYLNYITEKNSGKKSLLGSLKNAATGLIYANYEGEYNSLTENGTKEIPNEPETDFIGIENARRAAENLWNEFVNEVDCKANAVSIPAEMEESAMNADALLKPSPKMNASDVQKIMIQSCPGFSISGSNDEEI